VNRLLTPLLLCAFASAACNPAQTQRPYQFTAAAQPEDPIQALTRILVANGQTPVQGDPQAGIIQTRWENTGFGYGFIHSAPASIWRRYSVTVARREGSADVTVRADTQRCVEGASTLDGINILGDCTTQFAEGLVPAHQRQLDELGARLRSALGSAPSPQ